MAGDRLFGRAKEMTGYWGRWDYDEEALAAQHLVDFFVCCGMHKRTSDGW